MTSGVAEMLVQSQSGYTQFLPAIPNAWEEGNIQGLKARGNFTIGEKWANGVARHLQYVMMVKTKAIHLQVLIKILHLQKYMKMEKRFL